MKVLAADGMSFAVPVDSVVKIIEHFKKNGYFVLYFKYFSFHYSVNNKY